MISLAALAGNMVGRTTASAGTAYYATIPGRSGLIARLSKLQIDNAGTNNKFYLMRPLTASATVTTAQAASDTTLVLDRDPSPSGNTIASGDQVVYLASDGTYRRVTVSSWSAGTLTLTVSALPAAVAAGSYAWNFGVHTDTEPTTGTAFPLLDTPVSAVTTYSFDVGFSGFAGGAPLLLYTPNATAVTTLNFAEYGYTY